MDFNELAQWAAILFIGVFVFGLTRQLGVFLLPHSEQLAEVGPRTGRALTDTFLPKADIERLRTLAESSVTGVAALVVIGESCPSCVTIVESLESARTPVGVPLAAVMKECSEPDFRRRVAGAFALTFDDPTGDRTRAAGIIATPYAMVVDAEGIVRHKLVGPDLVDDLRRDFGATGPAGPLETVMVGKAAS